MDTKISDDLDTNEYVTTSKSVPMEVESNSKTAWDHRTPLIVLIYFLIPAITMIIIREHYMHKKQSRAQQCAVQNLCFLAFVTFSIFLLCYLASVYTVKELIYSRMYLVSSYFTCLFLLLLSFGYKRKPEFRMGIITAYLGIGISFVAVTLMYFYNEEPILLVIYNTGIFGFVFGLIMAFIKAINS